jgi:hypothetical protein
MSNHLAIAAVTRVLQSIVQEAAGAAVPGASVLTRRPEKATDGTPVDASINLFLLQATANEIWRNEDLPTRTADGTLRQRPRLAVDLMYLMSFQGDETTLVPQRMLGAVVAELHREPRITRPVIQRALAAATAGSDKSLASSDLADQVETITLTMQRPSLEELSRLWSALLAAPYSLSAFYLASVVFVEPDVAPVAATPVGEHGVSVTVGQGVVPG